MAESIQFFVPGLPVPKQSFRYTRNGGGYQSQKVKEWQIQVEFAALGATFGRVLLMGDVCVRLVFCLPDKRRRDWDNLAKGVMDALNGVVYRDDSQVVEAHIAKIVDRRVRPGVKVEITERENAMKFDVLYNHGHAGVIKQLDEAVWAWVVEPEFTGEQAKRMAAALNQNPDIDPDELYRVGGVG